MYARYPFIFRLTPSLDQAWIPSIPNNYPFTFFSLRLFILFQHTTPYMYRDRISSLFHPLFAHTSISWVGDGKIDISKESIISWICHDYPSTFFFFSRASFTLQIYLTFFFTTLRRFFLLDLKRGWKLSFLKLVKDNFAWRD